MAALNSPVKGAPGFLGQIWKWGAFVKFSHTIFALPFALAAMIVAARETHGWPGWRNLLLILMSIEVMLNAVNLTFIAFSRYNG